MIKAKCANQVGFVMIAHGWIAIDRAWLMSPESPFYKRRQWYALWSAIVLGAAYEPTLTCRVGEVRTTARELAELSGLSKSTVSRSLTWMTDIGLIECEVVRKSYQILINNYCLVSNMREFLSLEKPANAQNPDMGGTICLVGLQHLTNEDQTEKDCIKNGQQKIWDNRENGGTKVGQSVYHLTTEHDGEKGGVTNEGGTIIPQFVPIINNKEIHIHNYTHNSPPDAFGESQESDNLREPKSETAGEPVTDFDLAVAREWQERMDAPRRAKAEAEGKTFRPRKALLKKWAEAIAKLRRLDQVSEHEVRLILRIRFEDEFYRTVPMCPPSLRRTAENGRKKYENILAKAERLPKPKAAPRRLANGAIVSSSGMTVVMPGCDLDD